MMMIDISTMAIYELAEYQRSSEINSWLRTLNEVRKLPELEDE